MFGKKNKEPYDPQTEKVRYSDNFAVWDWEGYWENAGDLLAFLEFMKKKGYAPVGRISGYFIFKK